MQLESTVVTEGIAFQGYSKLARELVGLFQRIIDYRTARSGEKGKIESVLNFATQEMNTHLPGLVKTHLGFTLVKIVFSKSPHGGFAIKPVLANNMSTAVAMLRSEGNGYFRYLADSKKHGRILTYEEFLSVSQAISKADGKLDPTKLAPTLSKALMGGILYFDGCSAFLIKELMHQDLSYMTAEEIAAIVIHELGHVYEVLSRAGDQLRKCELLEQTTINFLRSAPIKERLKLITEHLQGDDAVTAQSSSVLQSTLDQEDRPTKPHPIILAMFLSLLVCLIGIGSIPVFIFRLLLGVSLDTRNDVDPWPGKLADIPTNLGYHQIGEINADRFVINHGLSAELVGALERLTQYHYGIFLASKASAPSGYRSSKAGWYMSYGTILLFHGVFFGSDMIIVHPRNADRFKKIRRNLTRNLTNASVMPQEMIDLVLLELDQIDAQILNQSKTNKFIGMLDTAREFLVRHLTVGAVLRNITDGKRVVEYTNLVDRIDSLLANPLYEKSARLASIASSRQS